MDWRRVPTLFDGDAVVPDVDVAADGDEAAVLPHGPLRGLALDQEGVLAGLLQHPLDTLHHGVLALSCPPHC